MSSWHNSLLAILVIGVIASCGCNDTQAVYLEHLAIININPSHGAVQIGYDTDVTVTLSEILLAETVNDINVCITVDSLPPEDELNPCVGTATLAAQIDYDPQTLTIVLQPADSLLPGREYTIHLTPGIRSASGSLPAVIRARFQTIQ